MPLGVKGRRSYPLLRLGSYKPMAFRPWVVDLPLFKVGVTRTGYTDVHAENEAAALEAVNSLSDADFYWPPDNWSRDDAFIVREDSDDPSK